MVAWQWNDSQCMKNLQAIGNHMFVISLSFFCQSLADFNQLAAIRMQQGTFRIRNEATKV